MADYDHYLRAVAIGMRHANDQSLAAHGITNQQARLLGEIYERIESRGEISRKALGEAMGIRGPSVTSLLNGLENSGFIVRRPGDKDGRTMQLEITAKAMRLIDETARVFAESERRLLQGFTEEQEKSFLELLQKAYRNIGIGSRA
ncbi:MAG: MarR family transcriptional regulator [Deltaproteobacteria bacterium]|jgi:DNA-binding MarR family transcriptional regulator|nr:MarR family transcriptional regulator [Deltaproteobacteria bacterium]